MARSTTTIKAAILKIELIKIPKIVAHAIRVEMLANASSEKNCDKVNGTPIRVSIRKYEKPRPR